MRLSERATPALQVAAAIVLAVGSYSAAWGQQATSTGSQYQLSDELGTLPSNSRSFDYGIQPQIEDDSGRRDSDGPLEIMHVPTGLFVRPADGTDGAEDGEEEFPMIPYGGGFGGEADDGLELDPGYSFSDSFRVGLPYAGGHGSEFEPQQPESESDEQSEIYPGCCSEDGYPEVEPPQPRGPQYEYTGLGEPWDSHARLLRAQDARRQAEREHDSAAGETRRASRELELLEMSPYGHYPEDMEEAEAEYRHANEHSNAASDRYYESLDKEIAAEEANAAAVEEFEEWQSRQPQREYPPLGPPQQRDYEQEASDARVAATRRYIESGLRNEYYDARLAHAEGTGSIEAVEEAYEALRSRNQY